MSYLKTLAKAELQRSSHQRNSARQSTEVPWANLEELFTSADFFGVPASPLQRAICRVIDGRDLGELAEHPDVVAAFNGAFPDDIPFELAILAGIRGGKSLLAAATAVHWSQRIDVSHLGAGDVPRVASVSITKDLAGAVFGHLEGTVMQRPALRALVHETPTAGRIVIRHPTGRPVEIVVSAGSRAGGSLVARWMAGVIFDEFAIMSSEGEAVINWDEQRKAVRNRILRGGGILHIGSPWAPFGPAFKLVRERWGKPGRDVCVVKAPGPAMNPSWWTPERVAESAQADPDAHQMTVLAEFGTPPEAMFSDFHLQRATREGPLELPYDRQLDYSAAMDPATRGNGWTLVIATRQGSKRIVAGVWEWRGSRAEPLDPEKVLGEIAAIMQRYHITHVDTDQWAADPLRVLARQHGIVLHDIGASTEELFERYKAFDVRLQAGDIELPPEPTMQSDLRRVMKRVTTRGFSIHLPNTSDGRHCDFAPAVMLALERYLKDEAPEPPKQGTNEWEEQQRALRRAAHKANEKLPWWKRRT